MQFSCEFEERVFNGTTSNHVYGADGLRRRTTVGTNVTDYVLDGQSAVRTLLNSSVDKTYLHGPRGPEYEDGCAKDEGEAALKDEG